MINKKEQLEILENALCWIVVLAMFIYGGAKIMQFDGAAKIDTAVSELSGMELMWAFYGYSKPFALILGALEIIGGLLLLFRKTRLIGCLFTSTILVNIILQDIFYNVNRGALQAAIIYQICIFIILFLHKTQVFNAIKKLYITRVNTQNTKSVIIKLALSFILFVLFRVLEYYLTH